MRFIIYIIYSYNESEVVRTERSSRLKKKNSTKKNKRSRSVSNSDTDRETDVHGYDSSSDGSESTFCGYCSDDSEKIDSREVDLLFKDLQILMLSRRSPKDKRVKSRVPAHYDIQNLLEYKKPRTVKYVNDDDNENNNCQEPYSDEEKLKSIAKNTAQIVNKKNQYHPYIVENGKRSVVVDDCETLGIRTNKMLGVGNRSKSCVLCNMRKSLPLNIFLDENTAVDSCFRCVLKIHEIIV